MESGASSEKRSCYGAGSCQTGNSWWWVDLVALVVKKKQQPTCHCRKQERGGFDPWVGKMPWKRRWQPPLAFWPGESHRQRSLAGCGPQGRTEPDTTEVTSHARRGEEVWNISGVWGMRRQNPSVSYQVNGSGVGTWAWGRGDKEGRKAFCLGLPQVKEKQVKGPCRRPWSQTLLVWKMFEEDPQGKNRSFMKSIIFRGETEIPESSLPPATQPGISRPCSMAEKRCLARQRSLETPCNAQILSTTASGSSH